MHTHDSLDAYAPNEVSQRVATVGVAKAALATGPLLMLGVLAGAFIGLGAMLYVLVRADSSLGFASSAVLGGLVFALGLMLVVVAGAELFTGNNLIIMARLDGRISTAQVLRNWMLACLGNAIGAAGLALVVFASGHLDLYGGQLAQQVVHIAQAKQALPWEQAFVRGVLCNVLVCLAVWMAMAGRSVVDKFVAVVPPVMAFVAAGFEHSIANMYLMPQAMLVQHFDSGVVSGPAITWGGMLGNWLAVMAGNLIGGSVLVGLSYHLIYRRSAARAEDQATIP